ncbi:hypothetical protein CSV63_02985 [Sporosarcina sp. P34]|nr:hypothetical protein CSV63_02985 [Sporosarcina sp. P34]
MMNLPNITANIPLEVQTIAEYVAPLFAEVKGQDIPKVYKPDLCVVQWEGDDVERETGVVDRYDRVFNILSFAKNQFESLQQIDTLQKHFTNIHSLQIKGSSRYMRIGSFLPSRPFLTEDKTVYASIGKLHAQVRQMAVQEVFPPIGGVIIRPGGPGLGPDGGIIINPGFGDDIIIGKDCRKGEM